MGRLRGFTAVTVLLLTCGAWASSERPLPPLAQAADYYLSNHDYRQALELWAEVYKTQPESVEAMLKVSNLNLLLEGHEPAQRIVLDFLNQQKQALSSLVLKNIRLQLNEMQVRFVKDESQSLYFQALAKMKWKDYSQALNLLNQALNIEKGNLAILEAKAQCEKKLGFYSKYYQTLKTGSEVAEVPRVWRENLLESAYYLKDYSEILKWVKKQGVVALSPREKLSVAMAFLEQGEETEAAFLLGPNKGGSASVLELPVRWYGLGKVFMKQYPSSHLVIQYFEKFLSLLKHPESALIEGWDPYRSQEKLTEVNSWLAQFKQSH